MKHRSYLCIQDLAVSPAPASVSQSPALTACLASLQSLVSIRFPAHPGDVRRDMFFIEKMLRVYKIDTDILFYDYKNSIFLHLHMGSLVDKTYCHQGQYQLSGIQFQSKSN